MKTTLAVILVALVSVSASSAQTLSTTKKKFIPGVSVLKPGEKMPTAATTKKAKTTSRKTR